MSAMKREEHPSYDSEHPMERLGPKPLHGSATSPGQPNLAAAQIPGPGVGRVVAGEDGRLTDAAADPWELQGHLGSQGSQSWFSRLFGRGRKNRKKT
ncbi:hypothetical protein [Zafaria cholistanensis]|nr:hypothetical protein [Zafaria cholistanensis]